jgi:hypothetical protein
MRRLLFFFAAIPLAGFVVAVDRLVEWGAAWTYALAATVCVAFLAVGLPWALLERDQK